MPSEKRMIKAGYSRREKITVAAVSLGCAKNRIDTEEILGCLADRGFVLTRDEHKADVIIVNTCGFIDDARQESINTLIRAASRASGDPPKRLVVAAGCLVEVAGKSLLRAMPEIDGAIGVHGYGHLEPFMRLVLSGKRVLIRKRPREESGALYPRVATTPRHSAWVKIAEGCDNRCCYCLIPSIRGPYRSREPADIVGEIEHLIVNGTREINLVAQDTTAYGSERSGLPGLAGLLREILKLEGFYRLRLMYTYPSRIDDELISLIATSEKICNYIDVPIQHCSDQVLGRMNRYYNRQDLVTLWRRLHEAIPGVALRTTVMVGHPGERKRENRELLEFLKQHPFKHLGAFTYSPQRGTPAADMVERAPRRVAEKRRAAVLRQQQGLALASNRELVGETLSVLVERAIKPGGRWYYGRTEQQAPEVDGGVYIYCRSQPLIGTWTKVKIFAAAPYDLLAVTVKR